MSRGQFTFYASFASALSRIKKKADRADAYDAICNYALYGTEPDMDKLPDSAAIAFDLIRPTLDSSRRKAESGKRGGMSKQTGSKLEANRKGEEPEREKEKEGENEKENENEDECLYSDGRDPGLAAVMTEYMNQIEPHPSYSSTESIKAYVKEIGPDVCLKAIEAAINAGARNWNYVNAVLQNKQRQGVRSLADWERQEARRQHKPADGMPDYSHTEDESL
jgi:DnaD/phage-associated family protein